MLNSTETARISTIIPSSPTSSPVNEQKTTSRPFSTCFDDLVPLRIGFYECIVPSTLKDGYCAAFKAYVDMDEQAPCGAYFLPTGYEYAHLTRQYLPSHLSSIDKRQWQRGFIAGWNACSLGFEEVDIDGEGVRTEGDEE